MDGVPRNVDLPGKARYISCKASLAQTSQTLDERKRILRDSAFWMAWSEQA